MDDHPDTSAPEDQLSSRSAFRALAAWAQANRLKASLLMISAVILLGGAVVLGVMFASADRSGTFTLAMALDALDEGRFAEAREIAEALRQPGRTATEDLGGPAFVLGAASSLEAEQAWVSDRRELHRVAARYLEEARDRGFPPGREPEGLRLLGRSLYFGGRIAASRPVLREALKVNPHKRPEIRQLLVEAYLGGANPEYERALEENSLYLSEPVLTARQQQRGLLERARILLRLDRVAECLETLARIPDNARDRAEAIVLEGEVLLHQAHQLRESRESDDIAPEKAGQIGAQRHAKIQTALQTLRRAERHDTLDTQAGRKALYLIGVCFQELGDDPAALEQFARIRRVHPRTPESFAALFQEAELMRRVDRNKAISLYGQVIAEAGSPERYDNPWIPLAELRQRILAAYRDCLAAEDFAACARLTAHLHPLFSPEEQLELAAKVYRDWGRSVLAKSESAPPGRAKLLATEGREKLRLAGREFERLSRLRIAEREYPDDLWEAAESYLAGHDFSNAARLYRRYLQNETRRRHPRALVGLAEALLAMDQVGEAIAACTECVEFYPRDAAAFSARLLAASAYEEKGQIKQAKRLLQQNLSGDDLTPASKEWRESLFELGRLLHREGAYDEAVQRLQEAVQRYPDSPRRTEADYLIADCRRLAAKDLAKKLQSDPVEHTRLARSKKMRELLNAALAKYRELQERLTRRQQTHELADLEKRILRNSCFSVGQMLFELGQYEESVKAYVAVTNRYANNPEVLDAYLQIARAYERLGKPAEAHGTLKQAKLVLARLKPEASFRSTTNFSREEWAALLDRLTAS